MANDRMRLHPEHGLNPMMSLCIICGETMGIALMGYNGGKEAPREAVCEIEPCKKCREEYLEKQQGVMIVGCNPDTRNPSGGLIIVKSSALDAMQIKYNNDTRAVMADESVLEHFRKLEQEAQSTQS